MLNTLKKLFMPRKKIVVDEEVSETAQEAITSTGPKGFNETVGEKLTVESFTAYMKNMEENEPEKFAKKKAELEKKLSELKVAKKITKKVAKKTK